MQVGDAPVAGEDAGALELDLLGGEFLEQAPAPTRVLSWTNESGLVRAARTIAMREDQHSRWH